MKQVVFVRNGRAVFDHVAVMVVLDTFRFLVRIVYGNQITLVAVIIIGCPVATVDKAGNLAVAAIYEGAAYISFYITTKAVQKRSWKSLNTSRFFATGSDYIQQSI